MKKKIVYGLLLTILLLETQHLFAEQTIVAKKIEKGPVVDGIPEESVWDRAQSVITHDNIAGVDVTLKSVYTDTNIYFLVIFPDKDESRTHKSWIWDKTKGIYIVGNDREDTFVFKWNMESKPVDLSIYASNQYKADVWFWKACRTDNSGYADDKVDILNFTEDKDAVKLNNKEGVLYLLRKEDKGKAAFRTELPIDYKGDVLPRFFPQEPTESRGDIKAKGRWKGGKWTIEFCRTLDTNNDDDIKFYTKLGKKYQFGISIFEIAGRKPNPKLSQPLYGCGDVSENLFLVFEEKDR